MVNVGGFFASLALVTDEGSFKKGIGMLNMLPGLLGKMGVATLGVASGFVAMGASSAAALTKLADNAKILGLSARQLDNWRNAARIAGGDADSFQESLSTLNKTFFNLKIGEVDKGTIQGLGMSGADFGAMQKMPMQDRIQYVLTRLESIKDPEMQKALTAKLLGQNGLTMLAQNQLSGSNFSNAYANASSRNLYTDENYSTAIKGKKTLDETRVSLEETFNKIGIEIETALLPQLQEFSQWLKNNKQGLDDFAKAIGSIAKFIMSLISGTVGVVQDLGKKEDWLVSRKVYGPKGTIDFANASAAMLLGNGQESKYYDLYSSGKLTLAQVNAIDANKTRFDLFKGGYTQAAATLPDSVIKTIADRAEAIVQRINHSTYIPGDYSSMKPGYENSLLAEAGKTLNINISTDGPISDKQAKMIGDAISSKVNAAGIRQ